MKRLSAIFRRMRSERGQALPLLALAMFVLIGFSGLAIDLGRVWVAKQQLQRAVDAAALAAGQDLPNSTNAYSAAVKYSGTGDNPVGGWGVAAANPSITFECVSHGPGYTAGSTPTCLTDSSGKNCHPSSDPNSPLPSGVTTCNAVTITESATVKPGLLGMFIPKFTLHATSTASAPQNLLPTPMNIFVIVDTTQSMTDSCNATVTGIPSNPEKLDCAKEGVRALLQELPPCPTNATSCSAQPVDEVGILTFPAVSMTLTSSNGQYQLPPTSSPFPTYLGYETDCTQNDKPAVTYPPYQRYTYNAGATAGGIPLSGPAAYDDPSGDNYAGYEAVPLSNDYRTSDSATTLNYSSNLVESVDWHQKCGSGNGNGTYPGGNYYGLKDVGGQGSYLAGAITEAQYLLATAPTRTGPNGQPVSNAIIILSDGELNDPDECDSSSETCPSSKNPTNPYKDGVDPGASGNIGWTTPAPCEDAVQAATQAKAAGTLIFSIAYDSSGNCDDSGGGTIYQGTALNLMNTLATSSSDFFNQSTAGSLTQAFQQAGAEVSGGTSALIPDCASASAANC